MFVRVRRACLADGCPLRVGSGRGRHPGSATGNISGMVSDRNGRSTEPAHALCGWLGLNFHELVLRNAR